MKLYPRGAEEKLGFDVLRAQLDVYTRSRLGQERLEHMRSGRSLEWVQGELGRVAELQDAFRFDDPVPLDHILDLREVLVLLTPDEAFVETDALHAIRLVLMTSRRLKRYMVARQGKYPHLVHAVERIEVLETVERHIAGVVDDEGRLRDDASADLRRIRRQILRKQNELRASVMEALRRAMQNGYATEEQPTLRGGRMVIPVRAEAKRKIHGFVHDTSATGQTVYIEPAQSLDLNNEVRELEAEERREIERILREVAAHVRLHLDALKGNLRVLAQFDLLQAKAHLANAVGGVVPQLNDKGIVDIRKGANPVLQLRFKRYNQEHPDEEKREVVALHLVLGESFNTLVITGPNAGGKSVAMKTVGLFALMIAYGIPIPVDPLSHMAYFKRLIVDIGDEQSIEEDLSTFSSHVKNLKYMIQHAGTDTLILIDEAGTGTDPAEGGALAQAVLEHLTEVGARTIATTHHGTLKVFAHETDGVENGSMQFDQSTLRPTYRFQTGIPGSSYAFEITQRIGLKRSIVKRSRQLVGSQKTALETLISTFEVRSQELATKLKAAEQNAREAAQAKTQYEEQRLRIRENREALRKQALAEAEQILKEANAQVERTIREIKEAEAAKDVTKEARAALESLKQNVTKRRQKVERRQQARTRASRPKKRPAETLAPHTLGVGDQVVLDSGTATAEVLAIEGKEAVLAFGSMRTRAKLNRLTKVGGPRPQQVTFRQVATGSRPALSVLAAQTNIDLRGQRVDEAILQVTRFIDVAIGANLNRVEVLHGKGTGALRQAIHDYLATRDDIGHFEEAPWDQGGAGVTVVTLA